MTVPGNPIPWKRVKRGAHGQSYPHPDSAAHQTTVGLCARVLVPEPVEGPMELRVRFFMATGRRTDGDNLMKNVWDSFNEIVWLDDSQVVEWSGAKSVDKTNPRTEVQVWKLVTDTP